MSYFPAISFFSLLSTKHFVKQKHLPAFNGFIKVRCDCATATMGRALFFVLESGVFNAEESKKKAEKRIALKDKMNFRKKGN